MTGAIDSEQIVEAFLAYTYVGEVVSVFVEANVAALADAVGALANLFLGTAHSRRLVDQA